MGQQDLSKQNGKMNFLRKTNIKPFRGLAQYGQGIENTMFEI